jgi:hypothetical protein
MVAIYRGEIKELKELLLPWVRIKADNSLQFLSIGRLRSGVRA